VISTQQALDELLSLVTTIDVEDIPLSQSAGRVLARPVVATRDQPPFATSTMDGYAICADDTVPGNTVTCVVGEAAAGTAFNGQINPGQCVRIFTGAVVPAATARVVIQEDVTVKDQEITLPVEFSNNINIRPQGADYKVGYEFNPDRRLTPSDIMLLASMGAGTVAVRRKPIVTIIPTGDELVQPGSPIEDGQIHASNSYGLKALLEAHGAESRLLPIARDNAPSLMVSFKMAQECDLIITIGGASEGDHDLVRPVAAELGMKTNFYKVAMRPGKPLMGGKLNGVPMVGLPGNPVSSLVCGHVFILPMLDAMLGLSPVSNSRLKAKLLVQLPPNGHREHYMRGVHSSGDVSPVKSQDSGLMHLMSQANCLIVRPPNDGIRQRGTEIDIIDI
jgi:molybdopterin molybdotransferase